VACSRQLDRDEQRQRDAAISARRTTSKASRTSRPYCLLKHRLRPIAMVMMPGQSPSRSKLQLQFSVK
jgi:hypothetical protein